MKQNEIFRRNMTSIVLALHTIFVGKIVRNFSFDKYRANHSAKRGGGEMMVVLDELAEVITGSENVEAEYERKELVMTINEFLYSVSERDRDIFVRRYFYVEDTACIAKSHCSLIFYLQLSGLRYKTSYGIALACIRFAGERLL